jgi:hypothetical protein
MRESQTETSSLVIEFESFSYVGMEWQIKRKKFTSQSEVVRGIVGSSIVVTTSTKGTLATAALNKSGLILRTPPISKPPALLPFMQNLSLEQNFFQLNVQHMQ